MKVNASEMFITTVLSLDAQAPNRCIFSISLCTTHNWSAKSAVFIWSRVDVSKISINVANQFWVKQGEMEICSAGGPELRTTGLFQWKTMVCMHNCGKDGSLGNTFKDQSCFHFEITD